MPDTAENAMGDAIKLARSLLGEEPDPDVVRVIGASAPRAETIDLAQMIVAGHVAQQRYWANQMRERPRGQQALLHG